jgi:hypothetical protein
MNTELMTGYADAGTQPLSRITIASLEDLGYTVDYTNADSYTAADLNPNCRCRRRRTLIDMIHGETRQLGLRIPGEQRRQLSEEMYNLAVSYGKAKLAEKKETQGQFGSLFNNNDGTANVVLDPTAEVQFVTNDVIAVFVIENGTFFDVVVRPGS